MQTIIGVIGDSDPDPETAALAEQAGAEIARTGAVLVCGGLGGVMQAAARGAKEAGGLTVGVLPGYEPETANPFIDIPIITGMGHARNVVIAATAHALIAMSGSYGTLSEIAIGLKLKKRVVSLGRDASPAGVVPAADAREAVRMALEGS